jgi:hypothetical protein
MDVLRQDFAFALRLLRRDKAFAIAVILTLGVCLCARCSCDRCRFRSPIGSC